MTRISISVSLVFPKPNPRRTFVGRFYPSRAARAAGAARAATDVKRRMDFLLLGAMFRSEEPTALLSLSRTGWSEAGVLPVFKATGSVLSDPGSEKFFAMRRRIRSLVFLRTAESLSGVTVWRRWCRCFRVDMYIVHQCYRCDRSERIKLQMLHLGSQSTAGSVCICFTSLVHHIL
jgi:hypothetical protein